MVFPGGWLVSSFGVMRSAVSPFQRKAHAVWCLGFVGVSALAAGALPRDALGRDYSLHMLAHVPKVCALTSVGPNIRLAREGERPRLMGSGSFRISCNVNYALSFSRVGPRAAVTAIAQGDTVSDGGADLILTLSTHDVDGTALEAACALPEPDVGGVCDAVSGPDDVRMPRPRGVGRLQVHRTAAEGIGDDEARVDRVRMKLMARI